MTQKTIIFCDWCGATESPGQIHGTHFPCPEVQFQELAKALQDGAPSPPEHLCKRCVDALVKAIKGAKRSCETRAVADEARRD